MKKSLTPEEMTDREQIREMKRKYFENTFLKTSAIIIAVVLAYSSVCIAYKNKATQAAAVNNSNYNSSVQNNNNNNNNNDNNSNNNSNSNFCKDNQSPNGNNANTNTPNSNKDDAVKSEIAETVKLYNDSVNRVKREAKTLTRNYKHMQSLDEYLELPSAIQSLGKTAMNTFVKGTDEAESWTSKEDMNLVFPVGGTDYSSHLTADMVKSAKATDNGDSYAVEIILFDDTVTSPEKGTGYAGVFNTVTASTFSDINIPTVKFEKVDVNGINGSIKCTIDKNSGRVTEITFCNTDILYLGVKVAFSNMNVKFALAVEENYTVQY